MSESQLAEDVRAAVQEATAGLRAPAGAAVRARSRARRRRAARGLLAIVPAAGVIAGLAVAAHGGGTAAPPVTAVAPSVTGSAPAVVTDAYVVSHVQAALRGANDFIIVTKATTGPGQVTTTYLDPATGTGRSVASIGGHKVTYWIKTTTSGGRDHWQTTYVDYTSRTWWTKNSQSGKLGKATSGDIVLPADASPDEIIKGLAVGQVRVGVKGKVNGHLAIELIYAGGLAAKAGAVRYWVDATTFQPVRIDLPPFTAATTITEAWIPKSAALVTETNTPQVPAGFRQVPPSPAFN
jgi:hypothetical protein